MGQGYELTVPYRRAREEFESLYERRYGLASPGEPIELTAFRVSATGARPAVDLPRVPRRRARERGRRRAWFPECGGFTETPVYERQELGAGQELEGPAIVEEAGSTTVLPPGVGATVDEWGSLLARW